MLQHPLTTGQFIVELQYCEYILNNSHIPGHALKKIIKNGRCLEEDTIYLRNIMHGVYQLQLNVQVDYSFVKLKNTQKLNISGSLTTFEVLSFIRFTLI